MSGNSMKIRSGVSGMFCDESVITHASCRILSPLPGGFMTGKGSLFEELTFEKTVLCQEILGCNFLDDPY